MKIIEWNINQRSNKNRLQMPEWVLREVLDQKADIIVLTEYCDTIDYNFVVNKLKEYNVERTNNPRGQNDVLIAIKKEFAVLNRKKLVSSFEKGEKDNPNFLRVDIKKGDKIVTVIGCRIRVGYGEYNKETRKYEKNEKNDYEMRGKQYKKIITEISNCENDVILIGDLNVSEKHTEYADFNWCKVNKSLPKGFTIYTPEEGYSFYNVKIQEEFCLDHIITNISEEIQLDYYWDYKEGREPIVYIPNRKIEPPYPDHAILIAEITISTE